MAQGRVRGQLLQGTGQSLHVEPPVRDRRRTDAQGLEPPCPKGLVGKTRDDQRRPTRPQSGARRAHATVMHQRRHTGKEPVMRRIVQTQHRVRQVPFAEAGPAAQQQGAQTAASRGFQDDVRRPFGIALDHAAKADVDRRRTGLQKILQAVRRPPVPVLQKPVPADLRQVVPVRRPRDQVPAEAVDHRVRPQILIIVGTSCGRQPQLLNAHGIEPVTHQLPAKAALQVVGQPVEVSAQGQMPRPLRKEECREGARGVKGLQPGAGSRDAQPLGDRRDRPAWS